MREQFPEMKITTANNYYKKAEVSCFVGQESGKLKVQFYGGKFNRENPFLRLA